MGAKEPTIASVKRIKRREDSSVEQEDAPLQATIGSLQHCHNTLLIYRACDDLEARTLNQLLTVGFVKALGRCWKAMRGGGVFT